MSNIPETVRENIRKLIEESTDSVRIGMISPVMKHMVTQLCYEMYKAGWRDANRAVFKSIELLQSEFDGRDKC